MKKLNKVLLLILIFWVETALAENLEDKHKYNSEYQTSDIITLLTEAKAISNCSEQECTQHSIAIKKLFQNNKLDSSAIKYVMQQEYPNLENDSNIGQIIGYNFENLLINLAIEGKEKYLDMLLYTADQKKHTEYRKLIEEYENIKVRREIYINSLCFLDSNSISEGSLYPNLYARCLVEKNRDHLIVTEKTIESFQSFD